MRVIALLFVLSVALIASPASAQENQADVIERAEQSVVRIEVRGIDGDSLGSGFIVDDSGTMITNCHVLAGARSATAYFNDGRSYPVTGTMIIDATRDIIVARIGSRDAPAIPLLPGLPRKGETVMALGAPHGLAFTATRGIVSAIRPQREMQADLGRPEVQGTWIQVDTAISPGNSGGPLINLKGEVVGMSTLASQGTAQNLNFGISAQDIANAIKYAQGVTPIPLSQAAMKVRMEGSGRGSPSSPGEPGSILDKRRIPNEVLVDYVKRGIDEFSRLKRDISQETKRLRSDLTDMRRGASYIPPSLGAGDAAIVRATVPGARSPRWFFASERIKEDTLDRQLERIREFSMLSRELKSEEDAESVFKLLWNFGPQLNTREIRSVGWANDIIVGHAFNDHDILVVKDEVPYLLWAPSTAGLGLGQLMSGPVFVVGTETAQSRDGMTASLTVLQLLEKDELRAVVDAHLGTGDGFRVWTSSSGTTVEAKEIDKDDTHVVLKKRDGGISRVPISALSSKDQALLRDN